jgi:VIT1/CCC1 family predicted Fe2+/Mn2+ transporter
LHSPDHGHCGGGRSGRTILLTAFGLVTGACSLALGEWLSVTNARELGPIYQSKGLDAAKARRVATQITRDKDKALDTLTREQPGLDPAELGGNPWTAGLVSFLLFSIGAVFPALPFIWAHGVAGIVQCIVLSSVGLAAIGVFTSLFNGREAVYSAVRQVLIGMVAAGFTFGVGKLLGVSMS